MYTTIFPRDMLQRTHTPNSHNSETHNYENNTVACPKNETAKTPIDRTQKSSARRDEKKKGDSKKEDEKSEGFAVSSFVYPSFSSVLFLLFMVNDEINPLSEKMIVKQSCFRLQAKRADPHGSVHSLSKPAASAEGIRSRVF